MGKLKVGIEAGGTKWICALGNEMGEILNEIIIPTTSPTETLHHVIEAIKQFTSDIQSIKSIGIGTFGPISLHPSAANYGTILNTPKEGWSNFNIIQPLKKEFGADLKIFLDTDVNTAVYAEAKIGVGKDVDNLCYITVGTGIGGGVMINGQILKGRLHPEIGHITVQESVNESSPSFSVCPFHNNCLEGKASGTALKKRWGDDPTNYPEKAWRNEAFYLAQLARTLTATYSPDRIVFGGGVSNHQALIPMIQEEFTKQAGGYWILPPVEEYIQLTSLSDRAGLIGAVMLAP